MAKTALILGGGAPNATLMAGALVAFEAAGVRFDVVSTAGAGALIGLLYLAPAKGSPAEALAATMGMGVADEIYQHYPVNYKVFQKPGAVADLYRKMLQMNPVAQFLANQHGDSQIEKLFADWMQLCYASFCPTDLTPQSLGLCSAVPFLEDTVDFAKLDRPGCPNFYLNAYNIDERRMQTFASRQGHVTADSVRAALAFPFLYPPHAMVNPESGRQCWYYEGAAHDCLNYKALVDHEPEVTHIVVFDILGADELMRTPRDLYDAWMLSIIVPQVAIAQDDTKLFEAVHNKKHKKTLLKMPFDIPADRWETSLDWSRSNLEGLFAIGKRSAERFLEKEGALLCR